MEHQLEKKQLDGSVADFLTGGGEMGERIRAFDWSQTPLGPVETWSPSLRMMVRFLLANRFPLLLWWGPQFIQLYNDHYRPVLGTKHPRRALGRPVRECWSEIWNIIGPLIETPFNGGLATWNEDILLEINRHGFVEEGHFTIAYSPVPDETVPSGIGGVLATVHEITDKVVAERRVAALRDLGARLGEAKTAEGACVIAAQMLAAHDKDVPFVLLYLIDADGMRARLAGAAGVGMGEEISPLTVELRGTQESGWPLLQAKHSEAMQVVEHLGDRFATVPPGPWCDSPNTAVVVPIPSNRAHELAGLMVAGVSARLKFDQLYRDFLEMVKTQIAAAIASARAYEEECKRAEALAELDRAKTAFFTNISHEFRTPLTLMLGPTEDALSEAIEPKQRQRLELVQRNALRLQKLVNTLLDFSRIEAGRIQACYEPTDLAALTNDLASTFRSAVEKVQMRLLVNCLPLSEPVFVDRDMWEKIVLNLVSNAFKFTLAGEIEVSLREAGNRVELAVRDTGPGIAAEQLPHIFERFHRVEGIRVRTHEGTGIGLALVQELVKLHGGTIDVRSAEGRGSTFIVTIPKGTAHLSAGRIESPRNPVSTAVTANHFLMEALRWLADDQRGKGLGGWDAGESNDASRLTADALPQIRPRILWADDNADMRDYVRHLLSVRYDVEAVADGEAALAAARRDLPDLILADIMMPRMDGLKLLRELRADERAATVPVILLSARAGEEAKVEGLDSGADDYLIKPFSAKELLARVEAHLKLQLARRKAEQALRQRTAQFETLLKDAPLGVYLIDGDFRIREVNPTALSAFGDIPDLIGRGFDEVIHILWPKAYADEIVRLFRHTLETGEPYITPERIEERLDRGATEYYEWQINRIPLPDGRYGVVCYFREISAQVLARQKITESEERYRTLVSVITDVPWTTDAEGRFVTPQPAWAAYTGQSGEELRDFGWARALHPDDRENVQAAWQRACETRSLYESHGQVWHASTQQYRYFEARATPLMAADDSVREWVGSCTDVHERKLAEEELQKLNVNLENRVLERTAELRRMIVERERLQEQLLQAQKMESVGTLASGIAHDFNNLLNIISSYAAIMRLDGKNPATVSEGTAIIEETVRRGAALVQQLMALGRKKETRLEPVELNSVIEKLASLLNETFSKTIVITLDLERGLPDIDGDENQLHQTLLNLCVNARDAMPDGGRIALKTETVSAEEVRSRIPEAEAQRYASISVSDSGSGMDEATQRRIFEPFFTTKPLGQGTGLGLAVAYGVVKNHGGFIDVESETGRGATFRIYLPIPNQPADRISGIESTDTARKRGSGETILFVDDEEQQLKVMRRFLENEGYKVFGARDGFEAVETFKRHKNEIAIAVLDLGLPKLGGWQAFQEMREVRPDLKVLVASGFVSAELEAEIAQGKLGGIIEKPYRLDDVLEKIAQAMQRSAADGKEQGAGS